MSLPCPRADVNGAWACSGRSARLGLRWWQVVLAFLPLALLPIGVVAMLANLVLARRPFSTGLKVAAMLGVVVLAYAADFVIAGVIYSVTHAV